MSDGSVTDSKDNLSLVLESKGVMKLEQRPIPTLGSKDVLVAVNTVGICGSDVHYWKNGGIGKFVVEAPMILGHESSGTVTEIGSEVKSLIPGDRVAMEVGVPCRACSFCKIGTYNLCPDMAFCATPPYDGTLTRYFAHPEDFCFKLPDSVSFEEGAFLEPLSVAVQACRKASVSIGQNIFINGAGPIGLSTLLVCKAAGVYKICIADIDENRLKIAKRIGADLTYRVDRNAEAKRISGEIIQTLGTNADVSIECTGAESSLEIATYVTKPGGIVQLIGMGSDFTKFPILDVIIRQVCIQGSFRYANCYPTALALIAGGKIDVKPLITHRFDLTQSLEAFRTAADPESQSIKVMIKCAK